jgi:sugar phosphate isomerase/epimerase
MSWRYAASTGCCVDRPVVQTLDALRRGGIGAVELGTPPRHFDPWNHGQVREVRDHLRRWSIEPVSIHAPFGGLLDLTDPNPHHRYAAIGAILTAAAALREFGGARVVVHASDAPRVEQNLGERLECCIQALRVLARACSQMHLTLIVETPLPHLVGGHPDEFSSIVGALDRSVGVCLDTSHATLGRHWDRLIGLVGERVIHVHANDHRGHFDDHLAPGDGIIDWTHIRDTLRQVGFQGWIVVELGCPIEAVQSYVGSAVRRTQELLG